MLAAFASSLSTVPQLSVACSVLWRLVPRLMPATLCLVARAVLCVLLGVDRER